MTKKHLITTLAAVLTVSLFFGVMTGCGNRNLPAGAAGDVHQTEADEEKGGVIAIKVNPEIAVFYDENGMVTKIEGRNDEGKKILTDFSDFEGKECKQVIRNLVAKMNEAGYLVEEAEGKGKQITLEIEAGSVLPEENFLSSIVAGIQEYTGTQKLNAPVEVNGESNYGWTNYGDSDYGPDNDGVTDYSSTDYGAESDGDTDYNKKNSQTADQGTSDKGSTGGSSGNANKNNATNYGNTDYGADSDGVTDYDNDNTDYGVSGSTNYDDGNTNYSSQSPAKPETTQPSKPEATQPAKPETTQPAKPETTQPSKPETTQPTQPAAPSGNSGYGNSGYGNSGYDDGNSGYDDGNSGYDNGNSGYDDGNSGYDDGDSGYDD